MDHGSPFADWRPRAVVFDCDGVLVDTEPCWTTAETEIFARRALSFGDARKALVIGKSLRAAAEVMAAAFGEPGRGPRIEVELLELVTEVVTGEALAFEDSLTGLRSAQTAGIRAVGVSALAHQEFPADRVVPTLRDPALPEWVGGLSHQPVEPWSRWPYAVSAAGLPVTASGGPSSRCPSQVDFARQTPSRFQNNVFCMHSGRWVKVRCGGP